MSLPQSCLACLSSLVVLAADWTPAPASELPIDLSSPGAAAQWKMLDDTATIAHGELVLDGRKQPSRAVFLPCQWDDVILRAKFLVEPAAEGVLACGFMVRLSDVETYYYVHFDRAQAILVRSDESQSWNEIKRVGALDKPPGEWHTGQLEARGDTLRVSLGGKLLYEAKDSRLKQGRIGFYAGQGKAHVKDIVVVGEGSRAEKALVVPPPLFGYVCRDAGAGGYQAFPDVCRLSDGRLMAVFYAGYGHVALPNAQLPKGGRVSYCTSSDEGHTWSKAETLYDGPDDDRDPSIVQLEDGRLICNFFSLRKSDKPGSPYIGLGSWMVTSTDLCRGARFQRAAQPTQPGHVGNVPHAFTWSAPQQIAKDYYCSSPIREISGGRLVLGLYRELPGTSAGAVAISDDGAKSWRVVDIANGGYRLDAETDVIELAGGTLYAAQRPTMCFSISKDRGETWSVSKPMGFEGHCPYFLRTRDNIILLTHRVPNTSLHYSLDECKTWSKNVPVDPHIGAYPSMVNLKDGSVLIVYYEEGAGSSIRCKRFQATKAGIEWLAP
jgi:sialidase-1